MDKKKIFIGDGLLNFNNEKVIGDFCEINGEKFYKIQNYDRMQPFFMSIVSNSDHWMFISSNGALTAGRKNADNALFPYYTDDKITDSAEITGSKTVIFINKNNKSFLWEPFSQFVKNQYKIQRNIYKSVIGNKLIFEEINIELEITFRYTWKNSDKFGFIKKSEILNNSDNQIEIDILDGIQNILPYGIDHTFQNRFSTLIDAYKKNELLHEPGMGIYYLSSIPTDKAEPSEGLKATIVWSVGQENKKYLLSSRQINNFKNGGDIIEETDIRASRGAYFINSRFNIDSGDNKNWYLIAEINQDIADIRRIEEIAKNTKNVIDHIEEDVKAGTEKLIKIVANSDGLQSSNDELINSRHFSNVLFNVMRGGIFINNYYIQKNDLIKYIIHFNKEIAKKNKQSLQSLPKSIQYDDLINRIKKLKDIDLLRLCYEYLPLTFSRRHGDPSRPWNMFSIETKNEDGSESLNYQGNWRDIFQNWEALSYSFPGFVESMIFKFLNASTADGYNPYRVTRDGFEWEEIDQADPWSNIGYWGDHQIVYLLKLLEISKNYHPEKLLDLLSAEIFVFANVPYKIKPFSSLIKDPKSTIDFDEELNTEIKLRVKELGADGKLILDNSGKAYKVNLIEKLLIPFLAKLSNFIPEAGIWMNTQRPEWNDANNALVGSGVSMVTLYYMRRYVVFFLNLLSLSGIQEIRLSEEVEKLIRKISEILYKNKKLLNGKISDNDRFNILSYLGNAGSDYRKIIYERGFSGRRSKIQISDLKSLFEISLEYIDHSIKANKRTDGLYHAYNLISINDKKIKIRHLYDMLEGQVAVLSSGFLNSNEVAEILQSLRKSKMYRADQKSYTLYPDRELPKFIEKNNIPKELVNKSKVIQELIKDNNQDIVLKDLNNVIHFNGSFRNVHDLKEKLEKLKTTKYKNLVNNEFELVLEIFEQVFDHQSFTGRSGTFYKYEGLGCIYWHMVSKLLLATEENIYKAYKTKVDKKLLNKIKKSFYEMQEGIGLHKSPFEYGAFPTDPYSHTPGIAGVQQPGMTGQVKEDIITRFGQLGIRIENGEISFKPVLLKKDEFVQNKKNFKYYNINDELKTIELDNNSLAFTFCQVPIIYKLADSYKIIIYNKNNKIEELESISINREISNKIFNRQSNIEKIIVEISNTQFE
ncbi:MAG: hypothetical protein JXB17_11880 [Bacteroidales bacterium]|nr:hypothetical protein [Bacteroidales bacterium]